MVSIIVPVYNVEEYLEECLLSISQQVYTDFEAIIIDDGSTDGTHEIYKKWIEKDHRFRYVLKTNGGPSSARNIGIEYSKGQFIAFVDGDDVLHPMYLSILMDLISRNEYAIVGVDMDRFINDLPLVNFQSGHNYHYLPEDALIEMLYQTGKMMTAPWGKLYRREYINDIKFKEGIIYEDLEWMVRVLENLPKSKRILISDMPLYFYRKREGSLMESFSERRLDVLKVTQGIEERVKDIRLLHAAQDRRLSANFDIFMQLSKLGKEKYNEQRKECWNEIKRLRFGSLINFHVRKKNKIGIMLSLFGPKITSLCGKYMVDKLKK